MGLGLLLRARARTPQPLDTIEQFVDTHYEDLIVRSGSSDTQYAVQLHPAAEDVEFTREGEYVVVSAKTSTAGPGYHALVCELLQRTGLDWTAAEDEGDETGYFESGDRNALEAEMLAWLKGLAGAVAQHIADGASNLMISLPIDNVLEFDGVIATPMGPRDAAWLERVQRDPREGIDIFPWWEPGRGARYLVGRAVSRMWIDVRWREPVDDDEQELLEEINEALAEAHRLDPSLKLPWAEWAEIARLLGEDDPTSGRGAKVAPKIGYRRRPVRASLTGGWSMVIPGEMATEIDDEGTWSGFTPGRTIWMSSFRIGDPDAPTLTAADTLPRTPVDGEPVALELPGDVAYRAYIGKTSEGDPQLTLEAAVPHRIAVFTIVFDDANQLEWAKSVASSVRHG